MSKPPSSICNRGLPLSAALLLLASCLSPDPGSDGTTDVVLTGSGESSGASEPVESTPGGLMTTTEEPDDDDSSGDEAETSATAGTTSTGATTSTTDIPANCGDGVTQLPEECDNGAGNSDTAACTLTCKLAVCGDGLVRTGVEACDDGKNDGSYEGCMPGCEALGPHCGDFEIQGDEECDSSNPMNSCIRETCKLATSCLEIVTSWPGVGSGPFPIYPKGDLVNAWCDMTTDGGGYTFVKVDGGGLTHAAAAEAECAKLGLHLLIPRSEGHLAATAAVAYDTLIKPKVGNNPPKPSDYLMIFAVYPVDVGFSCPGQPFDSEECVEWAAADGGEFWLQTDAPVPGQPSTNNCAGCSMAYYWTGQQLTSYEVVNGGGLGATSTHFLCDVGDKQPMRLP